MIVRVTSNWLSGCKFLKITAGDSSSWEAAAEMLFAGERTAEITRTTHETDITVRLNLDGTGKCDIQTGLGFFDHMLEQIGKHGMMDLYVRCNGDLHVDEHHSIEDTGIVLGECLLKALGDKRGIERYGYTLPMDDCLCQVALDFGGRPWLMWDAEFHREKIGRLRESSRHLHVASRWLLSATSITISFQAQRECFRIDLGVKSKVESMISFCCGNTFCRKG